MYGNNGFSCPFLWKENNQIFMLAGNTTGRIYLFKMPASIFGNAIIMDSSYAYLYAGTYSTPWFEDINGDGKNDLLSGNSAGGITYFSSQSPYVKIRENTFPEIRFFPNPTDDEVHFITYEPVKEILVYDVNGKKYSPPFNTQYGIVKVKTRFIPSGIYIFQITFGSGIIRKLCIIDHL